MAAKLFIEAANFVEGTVNPDSREVEVVLIRPGWSANGRYYSREVLQNAAGLFEGAKAYADHPTREQIRNGEGRSVKDVTGRYTNVRVGADGELRAVRKVYSNPAGDAVWPAIVDSIENRTPYIGLSINAVGTGGKGKVGDKEGFIVESITAANSVDDVTTPAAGGGFTSLMASADEITADLMAAMSYDEWVAVRPEFVESLRKQLKRERQTEALRAATQATEEAQQQVAALREQLEQAQSERDQYRESISRMEQRIALEQAFRKAGLRQDIEKQIREEIEQAEPEQWLSILERARAMAKSMQQRAVVTGAPRRVSTAPVVPIVEDTGPIDMTVFDTPAKFAAEVRRRAAKGR